MVHQFTRYIDPRLKYPCWKGALRFCYWMRSQGLDTYARINHPRRTITLLIANPKSSNRARDRTYWQQNTRTGNIVDKQFDTVWNDPRPLASSADTVLARGLNPPGVPDNVDLASLLPPAGFPSARVQYTAGSPHMLPAGFPATSILNGTGSASMLPPTGSPWGEADTAGLANLMGPLAFPAQDPDPGVVDFLAMLDAEEARSVARSDG
jgi:hypothetical protein